MHDYIPTYLTKEQRKSTQEMHSWLLGGSPGSVAAKGTTRHSQHAKHTQNIQLFRKISQSAPFQTSARELRSRGHQHFPSTPSVFSTGSFLARKLSRRPRPDQYRGPPIVAAGRRRRSRPHNSAVRLFCLAFLPPCLSPPWPRPLPASRPADGRLSD